MEIFPLNNCCSILELGNFPFDEWPRNLSNEDFKNNILRYHADELDFGEPDELPCVYIASTKPEQAKVAELLRHFGFKETKVEGRHRLDNDELKYLSFWMRKTQFKFVKDAIKKAKEKRGLD